MSIVLKISLNEDIRRLTMERVPSFDELTTLIKQLFAVGEVVIKYEDDEKDLVTATSDIELKEAVQLALKSQKVLRLFVTKKNKSEPKPEKKSCFEKDILEDIGGFVKNFDPETIFTSIGLTPEAFGNVMGVLQGANSGQDPAEMLNTLKNLVGPVPWLQDLFDISKKDTKCNIGRSSDGGSSSNNNNNNNNSQRPGIHIGVVCDGCEVTPIIGQRFKCTVCPDYDLCATCHAKGDVHSHPMMIVAPRGFGGFGCPFMRDHRSAAKPQEPQPEPTNVPAPAESPVPVESKIHELDQQHLQLRERMQKMQLAEEQRRHEEEQRRQEEEQRKREEEEQRKREEEQRRQEEEHRRKEEEEQQRKEEEQRKQEEQQRLKEEELRQQAEVAANATPEAVKEPVVAAPAMTVEESNAIAVLKSMGFGGTELLTVIRRNGGDVEGAIHELLG